MRFLKNPPLSSNAVKLIALVLMSADHVGMILFPDAVFLRCIGRPALPMFAYMIAEGCRYTSDRKKYLLRLFSVGLICQIFYFIFQKDKDVLFFNIFLTFTVSVLLCSCADAVRREMGKGNIAVPCAAAVSVIFALWLVLCGSESVFGIAIDCDGGLFGILLPLFVYVFDDRRAKLVSFAAGCLLLALYFGQTEFFCLFALIPIILYNGKRGRAKLKYFFYIYYPAHIALICGIGMIMSEK